MSSQPKSPDLKESNLIPIEEGESAPIAIIGLGGCFPGAENVEAFWQNIERGQTAIGPVPKDRWDSSLWFSEDRRAPDKTYSQIGGFLGAIPFNAKRFRIPPRTAGSVDDVQKIALTAVADALADAGLEVHPGSQEGRAFDRDRTAVILGNTMGGEFEDLTSLRVWFPLAQQALERSPDFQKLDREAQQAIIDQFEELYKKDLPSVTEDSMPGELPNCISGRIANCFDLRGPNFTTDAACAASLAAVKTAIKGLRDREYDLALAGGADRSMDPPAYVKFSKIGALSPNHSTPFDARANGFVMGEGVGILLLKRLEDAVRDGDHVYAVIRGVGAASDGRGKGLTAPNPRGQRMALERAYREAGVPIDSVGLFEAHGTSTSVGDSTELKVLSELLREAGAEKKGVPIGSVKSMIGHLKSAAGAASLIKATLALHHRVIPPSANFEAPTPESPLRENYLSVSTQAQPWPEGEAPRRAGVSAFGFGGTNFHAVLEEYPGPGATSIRAPNGASDPTSQTVAPLAAAASSPELDRAQILVEITSLFSEQTGYDAAELDPEHDLEQDLGIDTLKQAEVLGLLRERYDLPYDDKFRLSDTPTLNRMVEYVASRVQSKNGASPSVAQSSDVSNAPTTESEDSPWVVFAYAGPTKEAVVEGAKQCLNAASSLAEASLQARTDHIQGSVRLAFVARTRQEALEKVEDATRRKARMLLARGIFFSEKAVVRGDGQLAFLFPGQGSQYLGMFKDLADSFPAVAETFAEADRVLEPLIGAVLTDIVWANPAEDKRAEAELALRQTEVCQPAMLTADVAMLRLLAAHGVRPDVVAGHSLGEYAACVASGVLSFKDALYSVSARGRGMAEVKVDDNGKMASVSAPVEKIEEVLKHIEGYVIAANKNCHSQTVIAGATGAVEEAIRLFGEQKIEAREIPVSHAFHSAIVAPATKPLRKVLDTLTIGTPQVRILSNVDADYYPETRGPIVERMVRQLESPVEFIRSVERMHQDGARVFVEVGPRRAITGFVRNILDKKEHVAVATNHHKKSGVEAFLETLAALTAAGVPVELGGTADSTLIETVPAADQTKQEPSQPAPRSLSISGTARPVVSGLSLLLPSEQPVTAIDGDPYGSLLDGQNFIKTVDEDNRRAMLSKHIVRLNKTNGDFEPLKELGDVIQLAARLGKVDLVHEYGIDQGLDDALDGVSRLSIAAGIDALRDAGLPLVRHYRTTSTGKKLPDRWGLPRELSRTTGVIVASSFPAVNRLIDDVSQHVASQYAGQSAATIEELVETLSGQLQDPEDVERVRRAARSRIDSLRNESQLYTFNRKFLFWVLSMGHSQLAQVILAQGPNTQINAACASGTQALGIAQDWLAAGRCDRVLVVAADDVTSDTMLPWFGAGFVSAGAATTEGELQRAAVPFGQHRNGLILGSGASGYVVERPERVAERGLTPIAEIVLTRYLNSAFHGTRLDSQFIRETMDDVVSELEVSTGLDRRSLARQMFFMSHETFTPARGGSSAAEIESLRHSFGEGIQDLLIANTKGYTGHPMGAAFEDAIAIKGLQRGKLPAIANMDDLDPEFKDIRFAQGGAIESEYALRFSAGFGSQMAMAVFRKHADSEARLADGKVYHRWLDQLAGRSEAGLEIATRTLRIAEQGGCKAWELGVPSLQQMEQPVQRPSEEAAEPVPSPIAAAGSAAPASILDRDRLLGELTELFAEQTGYEPSDFEPQHELEADLGVDTVKQAEIFSVVREKYGLPQDENFRLSEVKTLQAVADYVVGARSNGTIVDSTPQLEAATPATSPRVTESATTSATEARNEPISSPEAVGSVPRDPSALIKELTELFAEQSGYEPDDFEPSYQLEADLGIDTVKQAEIFSLIRERYGLPKDDNFKLSDVQTLEAVARYVAQAQTATDTEHDRASSVPAPPVVEETGPQPTASASSSAPSVGSTSSPRTLTSEAGSQDLVSEITALFAEQTGYELEDFDPAYQLEADLGIDTVKQAEIFSLIRERYELPKDDNFKLSEVQTLEAVAAYVAKVRSGGTIAPAEATPKVATSEASAPQPAPNGASQSTGSNTDPALGAPGEGSQDLVSEITALFAEQTGYELEDFDPEYQLEADLGIDTVKQAEIFSLIRERYELPKDDNFKLSEVQTLQSVADYVAHRRTSLGSVEVSAVQDEGEPPVDSEREGSTGNVPPASTATQLPAAPPTPTPDNRFGAWRVVTGPAPGSEKERDLKGRRVVLAGGDSTWRSTFRAALTERGALVHLLEGDVRTQNDLEQRLADLGGQPADDIIFLVNQRSSLDVHDIEAQLEQAFCLTRAFARGRQDMAGAGLLFAGRGGGVFGVESPQQTGWILAALSGLAKSVAREWPEARCLTLDLDGQARLSDATDSAIDEWLSDGPGEIGWYQGERKTLRRERTPTPWAIDSWPGRATVVATGGARGVTYRILRTMAMRQPLRIAVLARTEGVPAEKSPLYGKSNDEQREVAKAALSLAGQRITPVAVKRWIARENAKIEVHENIEALRQLGSDVDVLVGDITDARSRDGAVAKIKDQWGHVDLLLHGAGVEESKFIADKDRDAFSRVFKPKAAGLWLWNALQPKRFLTMGSISGRFGNAGQTDYAAANELLSAFARSYDDRVVNVCWTAWDDIGMATRGSVKKVLEHAGIELLPADVGAQIGASLAMGGVAGDLVVAGKLGAFEESEPLPAIAAMPTNDPDRVPDETVPWVFDRQVGDTYVRQLDVNRDLGLDHHRIEGVAVLPGVIGIELMVQAARHRTGKHVQLLRDVRFATPVKLFRDEPLEVSVSVQAVGGSAFSLELSSAFRGPSGKTIRREHFSATAIVGEPKDLPLEDPPDIELARQPRLSRADIYRRYFHGPRFQVLGRVLAMGEDGIEVAPTLDRPTWFGDRGHRDFVSMPFLRETGFQAAGLWEMMELGRMALPSGIEELHLGTGLPLSGRALKVEARRRHSAKEGALFDVWVRDEDGNVYDLMRGYRTVTLRNLNAEERFEPAVAKGPVPTFMSVRLDEVATMLAEDETRTLARYLAPSEQTAFRALKTPKRRLEWLSGRIASKRLVRETRFASEGAIIPYAAITITTDWLGAPEVNLVGEADPGPRVSITHSAGIAAAFRSSDQDLRPGVDVERVQPRDPAFARNFFTQSEQDAAAASDDPDATLTAVWAIKEAVLKALGLGARVDLREVEAHRVGSRWRVRLHDEAKAWSSQINAGEPEVDVEFEEDDGGRRVIARVLLAAKSIHPHEVATAAQSAPEVSL